MRKIMVFMLCIMLCAGFSGCETDSYKAFMSIESGTRTSWSQKHDFLDGTKGHVLNLGKEEQKMVIEVVTEEGSVDIIAKDQNGKIEHRKSNNLQILHRRKGGNSDIMKAI